MMRMPLLMPTVVLAMAIGLAAQAPTTRTAEEQWAYDLLGMIYTKTPQPDGWRHALVKGLSDADAQTRALASRRLRALFAQSQADEYGGRSEWKALPFWGGGSQSQAREFRKNLIYEVTQRPLPDEAIDALRWLIHHDLQLGHQASAFDALKKIASPAADEAIGEVVRASPTNIRLLAEALDEAAARKLGGLAANVIAYSTDYRAPVREAARKHAAVLGVADVPEYVAEKAFTPWLEQEIADIATMVLTPIPPDAKWCEYSVAHDKTHYREASVQTLSGWLIEETPDAYRVLDTFAREHTFPKPKTTITASSLKDAAQTFLDLREKKDERGETSRDSLARLSLGGMATGQFHARFISVPEALVGAWLLKSGDRATAAALLFPRYSEAPDARHVKWAVRDMLGWHYHDELLDQFTSRRDYARAIGFAEHLSKPVFTDYRYQERAKELVEQLKRRAPEDFKTLKLPTPEEWTALQAKLSREEQINYLANRMRLLHCEQPGQPGNVGYTDPQYEQSSAELMAAPPGNRRPTPLINPYVELRRMKLEISELPILLPYLADRSYIPTYSYWRDFHPQRTLHRARWPIARVINKAAGRDLIDVDALEPISTDVRQALSSANRWIGENRHRTRVQLLLEVVEHSIEKAELLSAAGELVAAKNMDVLPLMVKRVMNSPAERAELLHLCYDLAPDRVVTEARKWSKDTQPSVQLWASMILVRAGDRSAQEGFDTLEEALSKITNGFPAFDELLSLKDERATAIACRVLSRPRPPEEIVRRLLVLGRQEAADWLARSLADSSTTGTQMSGAYQGKQVVIMRTRGDETAAMVARWRSDDFKFESMAPDEVRAKQRAELKEWVLAQFALIKEGKPSAIKDNGRPIYPPRWHVRTVDDF